jgi:hypothetical protein
MTVRKTVREPGTEEQYMRERVLPFRYTGHSVERVSDTDCRAMKNLDTDFWAEQDPVFYGKVYRRAVSW